MNFHILADALSISINLLMVFHVIVCLLLALVVLMQRPKQEGLGAAFGGGVTDGVFGAQATNVLQKSTVWLGTLFFVITLILAILIGKRYQDKDFTPDVSEADKTELPAGPATNADKAPKAPNPEDDLKMPAPKTPTTPPVTPPATPPVTPPAAPATPPTTPPVTPPAAPVTPPATPPAAPANGGTGTTGGQ